MFGIKKLLFGEKITVKINDLGSFTAQVKNPNKKNIIWSSTRKSKTHNNELVILLVGTIKGPHNEQTEVARYILNELDAIQKEIFERVQRNPKLQQAFKGQSIYSFYLSCLTPADEDTLSHELSFENNLNEITILATLKHKQITEIEILD